MSPHTQNFYDLFFFENLVNEPVLYIDSMRIRTGTIARQFTLDKRFLGGKPLNTRERMTQSLAVGDLLSFISVPWIRSYV